MAVGLLVLQGSVVALLVEVALLDSLRLVGLERLAVLVLVSLWGIPVSVRQ